MKVKQALNNDASGNGDDTESKKYECLHKGCIKRYKSMLSHSNHMKRCPLNTKSPRKVTKQKIGKDGTTKYKCKFCSKNYNTFQGAYRHQGLCNGARVKAGKEPLPEKKSKPTEFVCETCSRKFDRAKKLENHRKIQTGENNKVCIKCDRFFRRTDFYNSFIKDILKGKKSM